MAVTLTNPNKLLWPESGFTKADLRAYLEAVAPLLVDELRDRPLTVVRAPDGIEGFTFYQKQTPDYTPSSMRTVLLESPASKRRRVRYIVCDDAETLLWLGNQAALEFHPTLARLSRPDRPDALVLDLDPPEGRFDLAVAAALAIRAVCDEAGMTSVAKTTGGKGLHLYVPIQRRSSFEETERAAARLGERAIRREPSLFTLEFRKAARGGRVLVDVGRNTPGATMVSAFSPRARAGAPVSFPVAWDRLAQVDRAAFTIAAVPRLLGEPAVAAWRSARRDAQRLPSGLAAPG